MTRFGEATVSWKCPVPSIWTLCSVGVVSYWASWSSLKTSKSFPQHTARWSLCNPLISFIDILISAPVLDPKDVYYIVAYCCNHTCLDKWIIHRLPPYSTVKWQLGSVGHIYVYHVDWNRFKFGHSQPYHISRLVATDTVVYLGKRPWLYVDTAAQHYRHRTE